MPDLFGYLVEFLIKFIIELIRHFITKGCISGERDNTIRADELKKIYLTSSTIFSHVFMIRFVQLVKSVLCEY